MSLICAGLIILEWSGVSDMASSKTIVGVVDGDCLETSQWGRHSILVRLPVKGMWLVRVWHELRRSAARKALWSKHGSGAIGRRGVDV